MKTCLWMTAALVCASLVTGCGQKEQQAPPPPPVTVDTPVRRDVQRFVEFTGNTRAIEAVEVRARVSGALESMSFEPSHLVEQDELLFVIERTQYKALRDEAAATLRSAEAEFSRAKTDLERVQSAIKRNAVSQSDLDRAQANRDQAEAAVMGARARLSDADLKYSYTLVRSPVRGQVSRNLVDIGNIVGLDGPTLLTTVNNIDSIYVYFDVPERIVLAMLKAAGETIAEPDTIPTRASRDVIAEIATAIDVGYPHSGVIDYIDNTVNSETGTIQVRAVIPNGDYKLFPGLFVRVRVTGTLAENAILVSERAVGTDLGGKYVFVLGDNNIVEQRYIELGPPQDDGSVLVESGLSGEETYIVNGILRARPGLPVTPQRGDAAASGQR